MSHQGSLRRSESPGWGTCISLVTGPLQAIAATEAMLELGMRGPIFHYGRTPPLPGIRGLASLAGTGPVLWMNRSHRLSQIWSSLRAGSRVLSGRHVVVGSLHQRPFVWAAALTRGEAILVDDGTLTQGWAAARKEGVPSRGSLGRRVDERRMVVFSIYPVQAGSRDVVLRNRFNNVRGLYPSPIGSRDEVWVVGQPLIDHGYITTTQYLELLKPFVARFGSKSIVYVSHPRESDRTAEEVSAILGLTPRRLDTPIELELLAGAQVPRRIFSISSTVLDTLPLLRAEDAHLPELWTVGPDESLLREMPDVIARRIRKLRDRSDLHVAEGEGQAPLSPGRAEHG